MHYLRLQDYFVWWYHSYYYTEFNNKLNNKIISLNIHSFLNNIFLFIYNIILNYNNNIKWKRRSSSHKNLLSDYDEKIISIIIGGLLGDFTARRGKNNIINNNNDGVTITIAQSDIHKDYLFWLWDIFTKHDLCSDRIPKLESIHSFYKGKSIINYKYVLYISKRIAFIPIYEAFFQKNDNNKYIKGIYNYDLIYKYFTPLSLAIWVMDDGTNINGHIKLCTDSFTLETVELLQKLLLNKYNIETSLHNAGNNKNNKYRIYIKAKSMPIIIKLIKPYIHPSFNYKLGKKFI